MAKNGSIYIGKKPNSQRPAGARNKVLRATAERKRAEAQARQAKSAALTPQQRIANLDRAFGVGQGAAKERAKLQAKINSGTIASAFQLVGSLVASKPLPPPPPPGMAPLDTKKIKVMSKAAKARVAKRVAQ